MPLPRLQAIRYPAEPGHDVCYGLRLSSSSSTRSKGKERLTDEPERKDWAFEIGKISDDSLKSHLVGGYVGLSDGWYYFRLQSAGETHTFLASLFLTDIITRAEAESVLSRGPHSSPTAPSVASTSATPTPSYLSTTIHRLPSLATLGGAYWAGSSAMTELVASSSLLSAASGMTIAALPAATGALAVGGALLLFSRSARAGPAAEREEGELVRARREAEEGEQAGTEMVLYQARTARGRRMVDVERVYVLGPDELDENPIFYRPTGGRTIEDLARRWRIEGPPALSEDDGGDEAGAERRL